MTPKLFVSKAKAKLWYYIVSYTRDKKIYPYIYGSYWHFVFNKKNEKSNDNNYFGARPNPGAGIGHQLANWIAGYWFAKQFGLKFAHIPFAQNSWDLFLGFGEGEITVKELVKEQGYKKVLLPLFDENNSNEILQIKNIITSYSSSTVVFVTEQDQFYRNQYGVIDEIKEKFFNAPIRQKDKLIYSKDNFNIAIHVRRGDITIGQVNHNENLLMRWQTNEYFEKVLLNVIENFKPKKPLAIYLFSQGERKDFVDFDRFDNIYFCLDMDAQDSFLHMVYADMLITSKSSFSYKPALLNNGIKLCPKDFWHGYPDANDWILINENGLLDSEGKNNLYQRGVDIDSIN